MLELGRFHAVESTAFQPPSQHNIVPFDLDQEKSNLNGSKVDIFYCSVLGKGATGAVFQGVNKHNGETVAVRNIFESSLNY